MLRFEKSFTRQEAIPEAGIEAATSILRSGKLHRYNLEAGEEGEVAALEREYAAWQGARYCLATTSGGTAMQIALRSVGIEPGDMVLANAWTLAPVPGALHAVGAKVTLIETGQDLRIDLGDLAAKAESTKAKALMLSHMRGHIGRMDEIVQLCAEHNLTLIEDCAHTMGACWNGKRSGNFGHIACFSTQTYKHLNSGEGGFLTTNDPIFAAGAVILSGSYMLHGRHGAIPTTDVFDQVKLDMPNCSSRMDHLRAAILRPQLHGIEANIERWNARYRTLEAGIARIDGLSIIKRPKEERYVGSSIQFRFDGDASRIPGLIDLAAKRGIDLKWFGADEPKAFTSRYDSWRYLGDMPDLKRTKQALLHLLDMRVPLTFDLDDCQTITAILADIVSGFKK